jgi:hypothetical protein
LLDAASAAEAAASQAKLDAEEAAVFATLPKWRQEKIVAKKAAAVRAL